MKSWPMVNISPRREQLNIILAVDIGGGLVIIEGYVHTIKISDFSHKQISCDLYT